ncbi:MAG: cytochrome c peroxidase [Thiotrichaceae bacterium]|nr:cytochrome c peroxidase [Thiotrichaceae bacterium]
MVYFKIISPVICENSFIKKHVNNLILLSLYVLMSGFNCNAFANDYSIEDRHFYPRYSDKESLGKFLFFDKILSGNKNISCATCHHPLTGTGDGFSLSVGEGGTGLGKTRDTGQGTDTIVERVPRNAPPLFNLGAKEFKTLFHDGRVTISSEYESGFLSPAGNDLPKGLDNVLAVQAMFPIQSTTEMAGQMSENAIGHAATEGKLQGIDGVWKQLAKRLQAIPEYVELFKAIFPEEIVKAKDITMVHAANAIGAYEAYAWRCTNSAFDQYIKGDVDAVSPKAIRGGELFYGKADCASCHSGKFQTDHQFHAIGIPQIGPGKGDGIDGHADYGRERVTGNSEDRFKFRTSSLRQVVLTGPWGHDGAYDDLEQMVRHHLNAVEALNNYDTSQAVLCPREDLDKVDFAFHQDLSQRQILEEAIEIEPIELTDSEVSDLMAFLYALTDFQCLNLRHTIPTSVPSGLPLAE